MNTGIFITGSGTDVGKTFIAKHLVKALSEHRVVSVRKPVESDCRLEGGELLTKDAAALQALSNAGESIDQVCPYRFALCASPELAAKADDQTLDLAQLVAASQAPNFVLVEGAGGLYSPIAQQALNIDLAKALELPLILVVKDELGAINQALLTDTAAQSAGLRVLAIVLNQFEPNALANDQAIVQYTDTPVVLYQGDDAEFAKQMLGLIEQG